MRLKEAVKIIRTIEEQRQALNTIGEVLELAAGIEQKIKELERRRDNLEHEVADQAKKEHEAAVAALEAQHAKDVARLKAELDGLTKSIAAAKEEHERKMAMFDRVENEASENLETVWKDIRRLTEQLRHKSSLAKQVPQPSRMRLLIRRP